MNLFGNDEQYFSLFFFFIIIYLLTIQTLTLLILLIILYHTYNTNNTNTYTYNTKKHYNLKLRKKEPNTKKILVVTKIK